MVKEVDTNGFWRIRDNPLSKEGVFPYLGKQIDKSLIPDKIYWVYRPMSEISAPETVESFNAAPLIDEHEMIGEGWTRYDDRPAGGVVYNTHAKDGKLYGDIRIYSEKLKDEIESGKKELSMGYECNYEPEKGVFEGKQYDFVQRNLRGNHIALVNRGRMGSDVRVYDHFTFDTLEGIGEFEMEAMDKEWNEADHPRDDSNGQFIEKGSSSSNQFSKETKQKKVAELEAKVEKALNENNKDAYEAYQNQLNIEKQSLADLEKAEMTLGKMSENEENSELYQKRVNELKEKYPEITNNFHISSEKEFKELTGKSLSDFEKAYPMTKEEIAWKKGKSGEEVTLKLDDYKVTVQKNGEVRWYKDGKPLPEKNQTLKEDDIDKFILYGVKRKGFAVSDEEIPSQDGSPKESGVDSSFNIKGEDTLEKVDKRKGISEVEAMLYEAKKDPAKLTDELIKTILQKMENNSYEASEKTKADDEDVKESEDEAKSCKDGCKTEDGCKAKDEDDKKDDVKDESGVAKEENKEEAPTEEKKEEGKKEDKKAEDAMIAVADALPEILQSLNEIKASLAQKQSATDSAPITYGLDEETPAYSKNEDKVLKKYLGEI